MTNPTLIPTLCRTLPFISTVTRPCSAAVRAEAAKAQVLLLMMVGATVNTLLLRPGELDLVGTMPWCRLALINAFFFSFSGVRTWLQAAPAGVLLALRCALRHCSGHEEKREVCLAVVIVL